MDYSGSIKKELENSKKLVRSLVTSLRKKTSSSREAIVVFDQFAGVKALQDTKPVRLRLQYLIAYNPLEPMA